MVKEDFQLDYILGQIVGARESPRMIRLQKEKALAKKVLVSVTYNTNTLPLFWIPLRRKPKRQLQRWHNFYAEHNFPLGFGEKKKVHMKFLRGQQTFSEVKRGKFQYLNAKNKQRNKIR